MFQKKQEAEALGNSMKITKSWLLVTGESPKRGRGGFFVGGGGCPVRRGDKSNVSLKPQRD